MQRDARAFLFDAASHADAIVSFVEGRTLDEYLRDAMLRAAVERQFEIIGEALRQMSTTYPHLAERIPRIERIIGFRNVLVHGYAVVDHELVWRTVKEHLPALREHLGELLSELDRS